ncbi:helix-turn-helix domain-containing protein [Sorangium sp. So ce1097]|uniref:helix-turn-helix domain-containing protein n=1 Tax=Sorangium sp. So ce1097 TaxID=3133330 RepID=UPI003F5F4C23
MLLPPKATGLAAPAGVARPWPSVLATWGPGERSTLHAHHCWHLVLALDGELQLRTADESPPQPAGAVITAPDVAHAIDASGRRVLLVFVEPESDAGDGLAQALGAAKLEIVGSETADRLRSCVAAAGGGEFAAALPGVLQALGVALPPPSTRPRHPGVQRVLRHLRADDGGADTSLEALARVARLSPGRFMHAFTESVGVPLRPYLLWLKLERAGAAIAGGAALAEAAAAAGFADAAHMTRTFRRMFGVSPSDLRRRSQLVQDG